MLAVGAAGGAAAVAAAAAARAVRDEDGDDVQPDEGVVGFNVTSDDVTYNLGEYDGVRDSFTVSFCTFPGCYPFLIGEGAFHGMEWKVRRPVDREGD